MTVRTATSPRRPAAPASARALSLGVAAARALDAGLPGAVEIALHPGGYVRLVAPGPPERWLLLSTARAPIGPLTVSVGGLERTPLSPGTPILRAARDRIETPVLSIDVAAAQVVRPDPPGPLRPGWERALAAALARCPPAPAGLRGGLAALRRGAAPEAVAALAGRGPGLTPAGDDVLAGYAAWRHADGAPVALAALGGDRCSPLGMAYLRCAERGELPVVASAVLEAVRAGAIDRAGARAGALSRWGATSGAAMLWGMAAAAAHGATGATGAGM
jgi:hypothetical protein